MIHLESDRLQEDSNMPYPKFLVGEPLHDGSDLIIVDARDSDADVGAPATPINRGGSGVVYRATQADTIVRAVKVLHPEKRFLERRGWGDFIASFDKEKLRLAMVTHSHLAKLITFGMIPTGDEDAAPPGVPYIVMEFVEGRPLHEYLLALGDRHPYDGQAEVVVGLLDDVLSALWYLHRNDAAHCDVKEANILVRQSHRPEAVLVDLGAAHVLVAPEQETTAFYTTRSRVAPEWQVRIGTFVETSLIHSSRIELDLYMFGCMLRLFLNRDLPDPVIRYPWQPQLREALQFAVGYTGLIVFERISDKCLEGAYEHADAVRQDLAAILPRFVSPFGISELSIGTDTKTLLALPRDSVPLTDRVSAILNHPCVQRLRQIPQLDFVKLIYVGATHSRLLHSLETYNLARRYVGNLLGDPRFKAFCAEEAKLEAVLLASLLHDIGHYPLEHVFEDFSLKGDRDGPFSKIPRDEDVSASILGSAVPGFEFIVSAAKAYLEECKGVLRNDRIVPLPDLICERFGDDTLAFLNRILAYQNDPDPGVLILRSIVSGPLDVDKASYLRTDSRFSGATYGKAIDIDTLVGSLTCFSEPDAAIAIHEKGLCAAESIATARRWMFQRVYWHRTNRAIMAMLRYAPQFLLANDLVSFPEFFEAAYPLTDIEAVKWLDSCFQSATDGDAGSNPARLIVDGRRGIYKTILEFSPTDAREETTQIRSYLMNRTSTEWLNVAEEISRIAQAYDARVRQSDVLLDIPAPRRHRIGDAAVLLESQEIRRISEVSDEFRNAQDFFTRAAMSCRIFIHPELRRFLAGGGVLEPFKRAVVDYLRDQAGR